MLVVIQANFLQDVLLATAPLATNLRHIDFGSPCGQHTSKLIRLGNQLGWWLLERPFLSDFFFITILWCSVIMHEFVFRSRKYLSAWYVPDGSYSNPCVQPTWDWQSVSMRKEQREWKRDLWKSEWFNLGFQISLILQVLAPSSPYVKMNGDIFLMKWMDVFYSVRVCVCFSLRKHSSLSSSEKEKLGFDFVAARRSTISGSKSFNLLN